MEIGTWRELKIVGFCRLQMIAKTKMKINKMLSQRKIKKRTIRNQILLYNRMIKRN